MSTRPKILIICPSKYPEKLEKMLDSLLVTRSIHSKIIVNQEIKSVTKIFNQVFEDNPDEDFYFMANDDIVFETPLWDLELAVKGKISYGNDSYQGENLCTFPMIDGDIVRALGWLQLPTLEKYCGDVVWRTIGRSLNNLNYNSNVIMYHNWEELQIDKNTHDKDIGEFAKWLKVSHRDINKIRSALCGNMM